MHNILRPENLAFCIPVGDCGGDTDVENNGDGVDDVESDSDDDTEGDSDDGAKGGIDADVQDVIGVPCDT